MSKRTRNKYDKDYNDREPKRCKVCKYVVPRSASGALVWHDREGKEQDMGDMLTSCDGSRTDRWEEP